MSIKKLLGSLLLSALVFLPTIAMADTVLTIRSKDDFGLIPNTRFSITSGTETVKFRVGGTDEYIYSSSGSHIQISNQHGEVLLRDLPDGNYTITDITGSETLIPESSSVEVKVSSGSSNTVDFKYGSSLGSITIFAINQDGTAAKNKTFVIKDQSGNKLRFANTGSGYYLDPNGVSDIITDDMGSVSALNLPYANYLIEQLGDNQPEVFRQYVIVNSKDPRIVTATIASAVNQNSAVKILSKGENGEIVSGGTFEIYDSQNVKLGFDGTNYSQQSSIYSILIPSSGMLELKGIPLGTYTLKQVIAPASYTKSENILFNVDQGKITNITVLQKSSAGGLEIIKTDKDTNEPIENFEFSLLSIDDKEMRFIKSDKGYTYTTNEAEGTTSLLTDKNGKISVYGVPFQATVIVEKKAPDGYALSSERISKTLDPATSIIHATTSAKSSFSLVTVSDKGEIVKGVVVEIFDHNDQLLFSKISAENGEIHAPELKPGAYKLQVPSVPEGYSLPKEPISFEVLEDGAVNGLSDFKIQEAKIMASIGFMIDDQPMSGGKFVLFKDGEKYSEVETDEIGLAIFSKLPYGKYSVKQVSAPIGYELSSKEFNIVISEGYVNSAEPLQFFEENVEPEENVDQPKNDATESETAPAKQEKQKNGAIKIIFIALVFALGIGAAYYFSVLKNKEEKNTTTETKKEEKPKDEKKSKTSSDRKK